MTAGTAHGGIDCLIAVAGQLEWVQGPLLWVRGDNVHVTANEGHHCQDTRLSQQALVGTPTRFGIGALVFDDDIRSPAMD